MVLQSGQNNVVTFDADYYAQQNPDVVAAGIDLFSHFSQFGVFEGRNPNRFFDVDFYRSQNPDVAAAGVNAFEHFVNNGVGELRAPSALFDPAYYLRQNPDVAASGVNPIEHFGSFGIFEARDFTPLFDATFYGRANPDVVEAGVSLVQHFLENGIQENRAPSQFFDAAYYLQQNPDVAAAGVNAFDHFMSFGFQEARDPSAFFDTSFYQQQNADVLSGGINPLVHFVEQGIAQLRDPNADFDLQLIADENAGFLEAIAGGNIAVYTKIIKDAAEFVNSGGNLGGALSVAQNSTGDAAFIPPAPDASGDDTSSGGSEDTTTGGGSSGGGITYSSLLLSESGGVATIVGTSHGTSAIVVNLQDSTVSDNGPNVIVSTGSLSNVNTLIVSGITNVGLNLTAVRTGVATDVTGTSQDDTLTGGSGNDTFSAGAGDDQLIGGNGTDSLVGGTGADTLSGGLGADTLTGGADADEFANDAATDGIDTITDFTGADDALSSTSAASSFTYVAGTNLLVNAANSSHGFKFSNAAGVDNGTGLDDVNFSEANAGSGGGSFLSMNDNTGGLTGTGGGDLLYASGTTASKTLSGEGGADRIINDSTSGNTLSGGNGADTMSASSGDDSFDGGAAADVITTGGGTDTISNNGTSEGLDIITDFAGTTDILSSALEASAFTYFPANYRIVDNATQSHGWRFVSAAGADNSTAMHQQDFDVTNPNGGGKFMSETDDTGGLTGSANGDLLVLGGTTSGKTVSAGAGNDRIIDTTTNANIIDGEGGDDTMSGSDGADTFTGGADSDTFASTFGSGANDGLDIITDFTGADDTLDIQLNAALLTYSSATNALVSNSDNTQGFRFAASNGTDNGTGLDDVNFDETNGGAGGGKIMSMIDNTGDLTGSAQGDLLYVSGTTSGKVIDGGAQADRIIDDSANGNTLQGGSGDDTISAGAGDDSIYAGAGNDSIVAGEGADTISIVDDSDAIDLTETTKVLDVIEFGGSGINDASTVTGFDISNVGTDDALNFTEVSMIAGNAGAKNVVGSGSSIGQYDVDSVNFMGVILITDDAAVNFSDAAAVSAAAVTNLAANDAFIFVIDNGTNAAVFAWNDAVGAGGNADGVLDAAEFEHLITLSGISDVSAMDAANFGLV